MAPSAFTVTSGGKRKGKRIDQDLGGGSGATVSHILTSKWSGRRLSG